MKKVPVTLSLNLVLLVDPHEGPEASTFEVEAATLAAVTEAVSNLHLNGVLSEAIEDELGDDFDQGTVHVDYSEVKVMPRGAQNVGP